MMSRRVWFDRRFALGLSPSAFPDIVERIRGTPARLEERVRGTPADVLTERVGGRWSIQENVGHLGDLEALWAGRLDDLQERKPALRPADLENRTTQEAGHNDAPLDQLLLAFRSARMATVGRLDALNEAFLTRQSLHPRLQQPMTVVDLFFFTAEHDDHHLAAISQILNAR